MRRLLNPVTLAAAVLAACTPAPQADIEKFYVDLLYALAEVR